MAIINRFPSGGGASKAKWVCDFPGDATRPKARKLAYGHGIFVGLFGGNGVRVRRSSDTCKTWTDAGPVVPEVDGTSSLLFAGGRFYVFTHTKSWESVNGLKWTARTQSTYNTYAVTHCGGIFMAQSNNIIEPGIYTAADGISWTRYEIQRMPEVFLYFKETYVAIGEGGGSYSSKDLSTWAFTSSAQAGTPTFPAMITPGNNTMLSICNGIVFKSSDGVHWTSTNTPATYLAYGNGSFIRLVKGDTVGSRVDYQTYLSADGEVWEQVGTVQDASSLFYLDGRYMAFTGTDCALWHLPATYVQELLSASTLAQLDTINGEVV